jgi:hypothetical protein
VIHVCPTINAEDAENTERNGAPRCLRPLRSNGDTSLFLVLIVLAVGAQPAFAQHAWTGRGRVTLSVGPQMDTARLSESLTLTKYVEPAPVTAELPRAAVPFFDVGVALRLAGNLGAGISVSYVTNTGEAEVTAQIPHPFYFNQVRRITGTVPGVRHDELATHTDLVYLLMFPRIDLMVSGGASLFRVRQAFVSDVIHAEAYPYDAASFVDATLTTESSSAIGYNAGADLTWKLSPRWGVGAMIRLSRARVAFTIAETDASAEVGGLQAGGGLRLIF